MAWRDHELEEATEEPRALSPEEMGDRARERMEVEEESARRGFDGHFAAAESPVRMPGELPSPVRGGRWAPLERDEALSASDEEPTKPGGI